MHGWRCAGSGTASPSALAPQCHTVCVLTAANTCARAFLHSLSLLQCTAKAHPQRLICLPPPASAVVCRQRPMTPGGSTRSRSCRSCSNPNNPETRMCATEVRAGRGRDNTSTAAGMHKQQRNKRDLVQQACTHISHTQPMKVTKSVCRLQHNPI